MDKNKLFNERRCDNENKLFNERIYDNENKLFNERRCDNENNNYINLLYNFFFKKKCNNVNKINKKNIYNKELQDKKNKILKFNNKNNINIDVKYIDNTKYDDIEVGEYYKIYKKTSKYKNIIAETIFRTFERNDRLPEYLSGILCTINNFKSIMGEEWGYRIYFDKNILNDIKKEKNKN